MSGLRYIALRELRVGVGGETVVLKAGDEVPNPEEWGRSLDSNVNAGRIAAVPAEGMSEESLIGTPVDDLLDHLEARVDAPVVLSRFGDEALAGELRSRGLTVSASEDDADPAAAETESDADPQEDDASGEEGDSEASAEDAEPFPRAEGGGWYLLSSGEKVQGREAADEAQAALGTKA